jgi:hypothetical protein
MLFGNHVQTNSEILLRHIPFKVKALIDVRAFLDNGQNAKPIKNGTEFKIIKTRTSPNSNIIFFVTNITYNYLGQTYNLFIEYDKTNNTIRALEKGATVHIPFSDGLEIISNDHKHFYTTTKFLNVDGGADKLDVSQKDIDFKKYGFMLIAASVVFFIGLDIYRKVKK